MGRPLTRDPDPEPTTAPGPPAPPVLPRALVLLVGAAAAVGVTLGSRQLGWFIGPVVLALVIVILVHPVHGWLIRRGLPAPLALLLLLGCSYGVILVVAAIVTLSVARLAGLLPGYAGRAEALLTQLAEELARLGVGAPQIRAGLQDLDLSRVVAAITVLLGRVAGFGANVVFLFSLLLFMGIESTGMRGRLHVVAASRPGLAAALVGYARNTRRFLAVTTVFGLLTGLADTLLLLALGIPLALLWGLLAAICNYIPYVGFVIGVVPPALLALLEGGWPLMLVVIVAYVLLNALFTSVLAPYFIGDAVGVSVTVTFLGLVFWGWVLGPLGAVLAVPLTLLVKAVLIDSDPAAGWARAIVGSGPPR